MTKRNSTSGYAAYFSLGAEIAAALILPIFLGYWLDSYFQISPWLILSGCAIGVVNVFVIIFQLNEKLNDHT